MVLEQCAEMNQSNKVDISILWKQKLEFPNVWNLAKLYVIISLDWNYRTTKKFAWAVNKLMITNSLSSTSSLSDVACSMNYEV